MTADRWRWPLALAVVVQVLVLYWPDAGDLDGPPGLDKLVHAAVFAAVAATGRLAGVPLPLLAGALVAHAVVSETVQHLLLTGRSGDGWDVAADLVGTLAGLVLARPLGTATGRAP